MVEALSQSQKEQNRYILDSYRHSDGQHLPALFRQTYGDHYLSDAVYDPQHFDSANADGTALSLIARRQDNVPVAHLAIMRSAPYHGVREIGQAVVDPACRGGGILNGLIDRSVQVADWDVTAVACLVHRSPIIPIRSAASGGRNSPMSGSRSGSFPPG